MEKRERLEHAIGGEAIDRVPVCLWRHWQGDDQRAADLARSIVQFQRVYDWDFVVVAPSHHFCLTGYGLQDVWTGQISGERSVMKYPIKRSLDWTELRPLDPLRGDLAKQTECLRLLGNEFEPSSVPIVQVIYSPLSQAMRLAGKEMFIRNLRTQPDRIQTGLNALTETTLRFLDALKKTTIAGIYYVAETANHETLSEHEYALLGLPYDQKVLAALPNKWWLNTLFVDGQSPMVKAFADMPVQILNWHDADGGLDIEKSKTWFKGAIMGGLSKQEHLHDATPLSIREESRQSLNKTNGRRFILSCNGAMLVTTPVSNIQAVRDVVQMAVI